MTTTRSSVWGFGHQQESFLGGLIVGMRLSVHQDVYDPTFMGGGLSYPIKGDPQYKLDLELVYSETLAHNLSLSMESGGLLGSREIGWAHVCKYCGTTYVAGILMCPQCGGLTELIDGAVERARFSGHIESLRRETDNIDSYDRDLANVVVSLIEPPTLTQDNGGNVKIGFGELAHTTQPRARLCPWCGALCAWEGHSCLHCGGHRLPIKELQNLTRQCWYCGHTTVGNYLCEKCHVALNQQDNPRVFAQGAHQYGQ